MIIHVSFKGHLDTIKPVFKGHLNTVKPVFKGHLNNTENVSPYDKCPFITGSLTWGRYGAILTKRPLISMCPLLVYFVGADLTVMTTADEDVLYI